MLNGEEQVVAGEYQGGGMPVVCETPPFMNTGTAALFVSFNGTPYSQSNAHSVIEILAPPVYGALTPTMGPIQGSTEIVIEVENMHLSSYLAARVVLDGPIGT